MSLWDCNLGRLFGLVILFFIGARQSLAQQPLLIPDTLSGATITLTLKKDSAQFLPGNITQTNSFNSNHYLGPTLLLNKGDNVSMIVHNELDDTTTLHWHGMHVSPENDGGPHTVILPDSTWNPEFTVMDNASTYWYHPHLHMKTSMQIMKGAAGLIIVRDSLEATLNLPRKYGIDDFPLIIQSQQFDTLNQINYMGKKDSILLINGTINPYLIVPAQVVRFRLLNASKERSYNFGLSNNHSFYIIGTDGGLLTAPVLNTRIRLSPGERSEILLNLTGMNGDSIYLMSYASELPFGVHGGTTFPYQSPLNGSDFNILKLTVGVPTVNPITVIPSSLGMLNPFPTQQADVTRIINFTGNSSFNDNPYDMMRIDYVIPLNNIEIWQLHNQMADAHSFHIHDVQFYILDRDGNAPAPEESGKKDVVLVYPNETVRFITKFEDFADTTMPYMFHCHLLMHADMGMMGQFIVSPGDAPNTKPEATILTPMGGTLYKDADSIYFSGTAMDPENGMLPDSSFSWLVEFHHNNQVDPGPAIPDGVKSGSFSTQSNETSANVFFRLFLIVEDSYGLTDTSFVDIFPKKTSIHFSTDPPGLEVTLDGQSQTTPYSELAVVGMKRTIGVAETQTLNGTTFAFYNWSDGNAAIHDIIVQDSNMSYEAMFKSDSTTGIPVHLNFSGLNQLKIYPNPAAEAFTIEINRIDSTTTENVKLAIINILGEVIYYKEIVVKGKMEEIIKTDLKWPSGIYDIKLLTQMGVTNTKVLISK